MSNASDLPGLHRDLCGLRLALEREDYSQAGDTLARHDQRLRDYIDTVGRHAPLQALRGLLRLQHAHSPLPGGIAVHGEGLPS